MSKNTKTVKTEKRGPGRPAKQIKWPNGKFTFANLMVRNGVNLTTGKGSFCTKLTLNKALARDLALGKKSVIVRLAETRKPKGGIGRSSFVYELRNKTAQAKPAKRNKTTVTVGTDYEAQKAALLTPTPAVVITTPEPAPVTETPAPVVEQAPVAETTTDPVTA